MADIREQDLALKTTIADTDWIRLVTATGNHRMTVGQFKDLIGYTALQQRTTNLEDEVNTHLAEDETGDAHGWNSALRFKSGFFTRSTTLASGTQTINGLGFKPKAIIALATVTLGVGRMSIGMYDGNNAGGLLDGYNSTANTYIAHTALIAIRRGAESRHQYTASVASVNDDGFILNWEKGSAVSGGEIITVQYMAFR